LHTNACPYTVVQMRRPHKHEKPYGNITMTTRIGKAGKMRRKTKNRKCDTRWKGWKTQN